MAAAAAVASLALETVQVTWALENQLMLVLTRWSFDFEMPLVSMVGSVWYSSSTVADLLHSIAIAASLTSCVDWWRY